MAKRILVALDRSPLAESIVPLVADLAHGSGARVRLIHVAPEPRDVEDAAGRVVAYSNQEMERLTSEGLDYLRPLAGQLRPDPAESVVRFGDPVQEILREAEGFGRTSSRSRPRGGAASPARCSAAWPRRSCGGRHARAEAERRLRQIEVFKHLRAAARRGRPVA